MEQYLTPAICLGVVVILLIACKIYMNGGNNKYYPSLDGKVVLITGANTGIGYTAAVEMIKLKPKAMIFACRDQTRALNAIDKIKIETGFGDAIEFMALDLNDLESVKKFAEEFNSKYDKLDILLNNAGIMALPQR